MPCVEDFHRKTVVPVAVGHAHWPTLIGSCSERFSCEFDAARESSYVKTTWRTAPASVELARYQAKNSTRRSGLVGGSWQCLKFFAGFEAHGLAGRDAHLLPSARVASDTGLSRLHVEHAKAPQFDASSAAQRIFHRLENRFHRLLGLGPADVCFLNDGVYDVELDLNFLRKPLFLAGTPC